VPADQAIVELGVYQGKSVLALAWGASLGNSAHVWGVDSWDLMLETNEDISYLGKDFPPYHSEGNRRWAQWHTKSLGYSKAITLVQGFSAETGRNWSGPPVGLLYVDGDHSYEGVRADVDAWAPHLAPGATIVFDDYVSGFADTVIKAVEELVTAGVLEPIQLHAGRLAVTRLAERGLDELKQASAEGAEAARAYLDVPVANVERGGVAEPGDNPHVVATLPEPAPQPVDEAAKQEAPAEEPAAARLTVVEGELEGVAGGTSIEELTLEQMKALAKARGITLGARKDKKADTLQALRDGA
jgi:hypothetical protein